jgi:DNA mismatch endonuclease (patch repair protein)
MTSRSPISPMVNLSPRLRTSFSTLCRNRIRSWSDSAPNLCCEGFEIPCTFMAGNLIITIMADVLTQAQRKFCMSQIHGKHTKPELLVRRLVHSMGYRYRLHDRTLPGSPDLVFRSLQKLIFVHGCFWHRHRCKFGKPMPATRQNFWKTKLLQNKSRDQNTQRKLRRNGWDVLVIWECQTSDTDNLVIRLNNFLR